MFKNALIVEDYDATFRGIENIVEQKVRKIRKTQYCDDAMVKVMASKDSDTPFDLLITDLLFEEDHNKQKIQGGEDLILEVRSQIPTIKVIVFSVEKGVGRVQKLFDDYKIDAFVEKGRHESIYLAKAIEETHKGLTFCSPKMRQQLRNVDDISELDSKDISLIDMLSKGYKQQIIAENFSCSLSSVEKRINKLKMLFEASNQVHLISIAKDRGII